MGLVIGDRVKVLAHTANWALIWAPLVKSLIINRALCSWGIVEALQVESANFYHVWRLGWWPCLVPQEIKAANASTIWFVALLLCVEFIPLFQDKLFLASESNDNVQEQNSLLRADLRSLGFLVYPSLPEAVYRRCRQQKWKRKHNLLLTAAQLLFLDAP